MVLLFQSPLLGPIGNTHTHTHTHTHIYIYIRNLEMYKVL